MTVVIHFEKKILVNALAVSIGYSLNEKKNLSSQLR